MIRVASIFLAALLLVGCGGLPDEVSDTGYQGTWERGNERVTSTLAIVKHEGRYLVRWNKNSADGTVKVRCSWDGECEEFVEGEKTSDYSFRVWIDEERGNLRLECTGKVHQPSPLDVHYIDELVVKRQGSVLLSYTLSNLQRTYAFKEGPKRRLQKISDHVMDPPHGWHPPSG